MLDEMSKLSTLLKKMAMVINVWRSHEDQGKWTKEKAGRKIGCCWCNQHSMGRCLLVREIDREDRYTSISSLTASLGRASG